MHEHEFGCSIVVMSKDMKSRRFEDNIVVVVIVECVVSKKRMNYTEKC